MSVDRSSSLGAALFVVASVALAASAGRAAADETAGPFLTCLTRFYAGAADAVDGGAGLRLPNGTFVPVDEVAIRGPGAVADAPVLRELFEPPYVAGPITPPTGDPGRTRSSALLGATYGASERAVATALVPWRFHGHAFRVHPKALAAFERVGTRLEALIAADPSLAPFFESMGGTFNWRDIAGTHRPSAHGYGIAVDLNPKLAAYWRNGGAWTNRIPQAVVEAFEAEGFIWGGRWSHFDTMHFEWRPELLACASSLPPAVTPAWTYPWLANEAKGTRVDGTVATRFDPPEGFTRLPVAPTSFGSFLRTLPMAPAGTPVVSYAGKPMYDGGSDDFVSAVTGLDIGQGDLQQCADTVIRLHAEWLWALGVRAHAYDTASGTRLTFANFLAGERVKAHGSRLIAERSAAKRDSTRAAFRAYLDEVFAWANTASLRREGTPIAWGDLAPGDFLVMEGKPWGHAVLILDAARAPDGRVALLMGESAIPAQSFHVIRADPDHGPWFVVAPNDATIVTPVWEPFPKDALRRLPMPPLPSE